MLHAWNRYRPCSDSPLGKARPNCRKPCPKGRLGSWQPHRRVWLQMGGRNHGWRQQTSSSCVPLALQHLVEPPRLLWSPTCSMNYPSHLFYMTMGRPNQCVCVAHTTIKFWWHGPNILSQTTQSHAWNWSCNPLLRMSSHISLVELAWIYLLRNIQKIEIVLGRKTFPS